MPRPWGAAPNPAFATWQGCGAGGRFTPWSPHPMCEHWVASSSSRSRSEPRKRGPHDRSLTLTSLGAEQGSRGRGIPQPRRGEDMPRKPLDACAVTHAYGSGVGNEGSVATVGPSPRASRRRVRGVGQSPTVLAERSEEKAPRLRGHFRERSDRQGVPSEAPAGRSPERCLIEARDKN